MEEFFQSVNQPRIVFIFRNEPYQRIVEFFDGERGNRDMDMRYQIAVGLDGKKVIKWGLVVEMKRFDIFEFVDSLPATIPLVVR